MDRHNRAALIYAANVMSATVVVVTAIAITRWAAVKFDIAWLRPVSVNIIRAVLRSMCLWRL